MTERMKNSIQLADNPTLLPYNDILLYNKRKNSIQELSFSRQGPGEVKGVQNYQTTQLLSNHGVFSIHSTFHDWDFGMSFELLSLLGLAKEDRFLPENFRRRQLFRYWLNGIIRDEAQRKINPNSLIHYYVTGSNQCHGKINERNHDATIDTITHTNHLTLLPGKIILLFGKLFMDDEREHLDFAQIPEKTDGQNMFLFMKFLKEEMKLDSLDCVWPSLIVRTKSHSILEVIDSIPEDEYREFMSIFYKNDEKIISKLEKKTDKVYPLMAHDIIAFMLWYCYKGMPLDRQIISEVPPKLNPYTEFWIYSNIVQEEIVSTGFGKLLAMCTTPNNLSIGNQAEVTYNFPVFKNISTKILDEIEILIATPFGYPVPFIAGPSTVQLLFEAREK
jgi:hypothetical protein